MKTLGPHFPGGWICLSASVKELFRVGSHEGLAVQASWFMGVAAQFSLLRNQERISKLGKKYVKVVYCHPANFTLM